jgi:hypothetical protein
MCGDILAQQGSQLKISEISIAADYIMILHLNECFTI